MNYRRVKYRYSNFGNNLNGDQDTKAVEIWFPDGIITRTDILSKIDEPAIKAIIDKWIDINGSPDVYEASRIWLDNTNYKYFKQLSDLPVDHVGNALINKNLDSVKELKHYCVVFNISYLMVENSLVTDILVG